MQLEKYLGTIITIAVLGGGQLIEVGLRKAKMANYEARLTRVEDQGSSYTRELMVEIKTRISQLEERQKAAESRQNGIEKSLNEINTSVKVIESWIRNQTHQ